MHSVWVEKYRPKTLNQVVNQKDIVERLKKFVENKSLPHLIFSGPAGVGKTTCAHALVRDLFGKFYSRDAFQELNASDERGIDVIRNSIKNFASKGSITGIPFKILILDESDNMTSAAQQALRRTMEKFTRSTRFILICNYSSKIIEPIQSRCAVFRFKPLKEPDIALRIKSICKKEEKKIDDSGLNAILYVSNGDLRKAVNTLQAAASLNQNITEDLIYQVTGKARPEEIQSMLNLAINKKFLDSKIELEKLLFDYGLSGIDIIRQIHQEIFRLDIGENKKIKLIDIVGEINFRLIEGANELIQLSSLLAQFSKIS